MTRLNTYRERTVTTYADLRLGDRVRAGAVGLATVRKVLHRDGKVLAVIGKPGWVAGRTLSAPIDAPVTVMRVSDYIRFVTDDGCVQVLDLAAKGSEFEPETQDVYDDKGAVVRTVMVNRYATVCIEHSMLSTHPTLTLARAHATDPEGWCEAHREDTACGCMAEDPGDGFGLRVVTHSAGCAEHPEAGL